MQGRASEGGPPEPRVGSPCEGRPSPRPGLGRGTELLLGAPGCLSQTSKVIPLFELLERDTARN